MMNPLPSMAQAFALLVQEEKQREFKASSQMFAEASSMKFSMLASAPGPPGGRQQQFKTNYSFSSNNNGRSRPLCDYCKKLRHTKDKCFKIYGYPQNRQSNTQNQRSSSHYDANQRSSTHFDAGHNQFRKSNKGKGIAVNVFGTEAQDNTEKHVGSSNSQCLTKDQYSQLLNLLQHFQLSNT